MLTRKNMGYPGRTFNVILLMSSQLRQTLSLFPSRRGQGHATAAASIEHTTPNHTRRRSPRENVSASAVTAD